MSASPSPPDDTGEYAALTLGSPWGLISLLLFTAALTSRQLVRLLPVHLQGWNIMPPAAVLAVPPLALLGLLCGLVGMRRLERRTISVLGAALNGILLLLAVALLLGFWWVRYR